MRRCKIVVMSDSHGFDNAIDKVISENKDANYFIHCGDFCSEPHNYPNLIIVRGNNDYNNLPEFIVQEYGGINMLIIHSHQTGFFNREDSLVYQAQKYNAKFVLYGHTHSYDEQLIRGIQLLNPGSIWHNRDGGDPSYAVLEINTDNSYKIYRKSIK